MASRFVCPPPTTDVEIPAHVLAVDGSYYESSLDDRLPSTKVGYVKVGSVLIDMHEFGALQDPETRFVDPFKVARLQDSNSPLAFTLPGANVQWAGRRNVRDSFRAVLDDHLYGPVTRFKNDDPYTSLRTTLFHLAARRPGELGTNDPSRLRIHKCPSCDSGPIELIDVPEQQYCHSCGAEIFPSDCLRIWEEVTEYQSSSEALSRLMLALEHMIPIHYLRYLAQHSLELAGSLVFFVDGPLAVFGNSAWLSRAIMLFLDDMNQQLTRRGLPRILMIGLQKTGQIVDHVVLIERFIPSNRILSIDDEYRYKYIVISREAARNGFGSETYYGHDFVLKTNSGRTFVFGIPYPFRSKEDPTIDFIHAKAEMSRYEDLPRAVRLIEHFESDLYRNAVIPIALAHRYTAISLRPGGQVLDVLTRGRLSESIRQSE